MNNLSLHLSGSKLTPLRLIAITSAFEEAWATSESEPRLEEYLPDSKDYPNEGLLEELVSIEFYWRRNSNRKLSLEELRNRLTIPREIVDRVWRSCLKTASEWDTTIKLPNNWSQCNYELIRPIGRGGMGDVYLAKHRQMQGRLFAIKFIRHEMAKPRTEDRFRKEVKALSRLKHPNIVYAADAFLETDSMFLVMEYVPGLSLQAFVDEHGPLDFDIVADILKQAAMGLGQAHQGYIIHRDIKPANLLLGYEGTIKIVDLGLASLQADENAMTANNDVLGSAPFIAPELWLDARNASAQSDLYALGCTIYYCLTGKSPYQHLEANTVQDWMSAHLNHPPTPLQEARPATPKALANLVASLLNKNPDDRPVDAQAVVKLANSLSAQQVKSACDPESKITGDNRVQSSNMEESLPRRKTKANRSIAWATGLLLLSLSALLLSYFGPFTTATWQLRFGKLGNPETPVFVGFCIEALRSLIYVTLTIWILETSFNRELRNLFNLRSWTRTLLFMRLFILLTITTFVLMESSRMLDTAGQPTELAEWGQDREFETNSTLESTPYRFYLIYSLTNYIVVMGGLFAVPFLGFVLFDLVAINQHYKSFVALQQNSRSGAVLTDGLHRYGANLRKISSRYVSTLGVLAVGVQFEFWIGASTLTESGLITLQLGIAVVCIAAVFTLTIASFFLRAQSLTLDAIGKYGTLQDEQNISKIDTIWFAKNLILKNPGGLIVLSLIPILFSYLVK